MLSAAIHYATLNSFRSIKLPSSLYKPPVLMLAPTAPLSRGILLHSRRHRVLCRIYWAAARWTVGDTSMHELVMFSFLIRRKWRSCLRLTPIFVWTRCGVTPDVANQMLAAAIWTLFWGNFKNEPRAFSNLKFCATGFFNGWHNQSIILALAQSRLLNASMESYFVRSP